MDNQPAGISFALVGHQDSWARVHTLINDMRRESGMPLLSSETIKDVFPFIPPRDLFEIHVRSKQCGLLRGVYIETFISPDELDARHLYGNIIKVKQACELAAKIKAPVTALGGITSIVLENEMSSFKQIENSFFTTGNTLTAAFIVKAVERELEERSLSLSDVKVLIIGSTGDIGSACVNYFSGKINSFLLNARREALLKKQCAELTRNNQDSKYSTRLDDLLPEADVVISVASSLVENCDLSLLPCHAIVCDGGYPKNLCDSFLYENKNAFPGGLGIVEGGFDIEPKRYKQFYEFPLPEVVYGCLLEAIVLAMEKNNCAYSCGRGNISLQAMEKIYSSANKHGIALAPRFNYPGFSIKTFQKNCDENNNQGPGATFQTHLHA